jgi:YggT family protein
MRARRTICDPYLNLFRGIIPPLGGTLDLSPILAFIVLDVRPRLRVHY